MNLTTTKIIMSFPIVGWMSQKGYLGFAKCKLVLFKGRSLRSNPEFTKQLDYYNSLLDKK